MKGKTPKSVKYGLTALFIALLAYGGYRFFLTHAEVLTLRSELLGTLSKLSAVESENQALKETLQAEQAKNSSFENQIKEIAGTVGTLDKLSKTDKELLQKYSKVYFLNEHFVPQSLATITPDFVYESGRAQKIHAKVWPNLERLLKDAERQGVKLLIVSAYRSFGEQSSLKGAYTVTYGSGANRFSADQGYSEHQLGTALDFTSKELMSNFTAFSKDPGYGWLLENAYKYGFVLSYPENNFYYQFEPWHWRFVGVALAKRLHEDRQYFYDLDQRVIDLYLVSIFD